MRWPGIIGTTDLSQSPIADAERTVNWYLEPLPTHGKNAAALYPTPGGQMFLTVSDIGARGLLTINARTFAVIATGVYELFATNTSTKYGTVTQDNNLATLTTNGATGAQLFLTSGTNGYILNLTTNALSQVLTGTATMGGMLDGHFIAFDAAIGKIRISNLNDGLTWDPTQFAQRSSAPDNWKAMLVNAPDL